MNMISSKGLGLDQMNAIDNIAYTEMEIGSKHNLTSDSASNQHRQLD